MKTTAFLCSLIVAGASAFGTTSLSSFTGTHISTVMEPTVAPRTHGSKSSSLEMMRHRKKLAKLGKPADQRKALLRSSPPKSSVTDASRPRPSAPRPCASTSIT
eukprot:679923_1